MSIWNMKIFSFMFLDPPLFLDPLLKDKYIYRMEFTDNRTEFWLEVLMMFSVGVKEYIRARNVFNTTSRFKHAYEWSSHQLPTFSHRTHLVICHRSILL